MKRIRCPQCSIVNLEKFVTFPHCAGCGALLPTTGEGEAVPSYRRPLQPLLWAIIIGMPTLCLLLALVRFDVATEAMGRVLIYGRIPRVTRAGRRIEAVLTIDAINDITHRTPRTLQSVTVRVPLKFLKSFRVVEVLPPPEKVIVSDKGRYFCYSELATNSDVHIVFEAVDPGTHIFDAMVYANDHAVADYRVGVIVKPPSTPVVSPRP